MVLLGQLLTRLMLKKMGTGGVGGPAMTFGKSNAKDLCGGANGQDL